MGIKRVQCRMKVGHQQRGSAFTEHLDLDDIGEVRARARTLAEERRLDPEKAVLEVKQNGRWVPYRP